MTQARKQSASKLTFSAVVLNLEVLARPSGSGRISVASGARRLIECGRSVVGCCCCCLGGGQAASWVGHASFGRGLFVCD